MSTEAVVAQSISSPASSLVQVSAALCVIILLILVVAWFAKRFGFAPRHNQNKTLNIRASVTVGPREKVIIVEVPDARLVLGVTATQITHLHTLPPADPTAESVEAQLPDKPAVENFQDLMKQLLQRQRKR